MKGKHDIVEEKEKGGSVRKGRTWKWRGGKRRNRSEELREQLKKRNTEGKARQGKGEELLRGNWFEKEKEKAE